MVLRPIISNLECDVCHSPSPLCRRPRALHQMLLLLHRADKKQSFTGAEGLIENWDYFRKLCHGLEHFAQNCCSASNRGWNRGLGSANPIEGIQFGNHWQPIRAN